jgi:hypothetical protein
MSAMIFIQNKYTKWYNSIIFNAQTRTLPKDTYIERHHIIPRSLGGDNSVDNLVKLLAREHFICHLLLIKMTIGSNRMKMNFAFANMSRTSGNQQRYINNRLFEIFKKDRKHTSESKKKMSNAAIGRKQSPETIEKRVSKLRGKESPIKGRHIHSEESKKKLSIASTNRMASMSPEKKAEIYKKVSNPKYWNKDRIENMRINMIGKKKTKTPKLLAAFEARRERCTQNILKAAENHRGKTWKLVNGKRVWMDKEN